MIARYSPIRLSAAKFGSMILTFAAFLACSGNPISDSIPPDDRQSTADLSRIRQSLDRGATLLPADFEALKAIHAKYPRVRPVGEIYRSALIKRGDWETLEKLITKTPPADRFPEDIKNLARVYYKLGRFDEAVAAADPLAESNPVDLEMNGIVASSYFNLGKDTEAAAQIDRHWDAIVAAKRVDDIIVRGIIHSRNKESDQAIAVLLKANELAPDNVTTLNALARAYNDSGNTEKAEEFRKLTGSIQERKTQTERMAMQEVRLIYELQARWEAKDYPEVIRLARLALPIAGASNQAALYQYIAEASKALGRADEARAALAELEKLKR